MEDYIDALLEYLSDRRNDAMSFPSAAQLAREEEAFEALSRTFTEEQRRLFHAYDDARTAFAAAYTEEEICKWLGCFYSRFFSQQFKRSCLPDCPKVGSIALSPRGDLRMPSDASAAVWMAEMEQLRQSTECR